MLTLGYTAVGRLWLLRGKNMEAAKGLGGEAEVVTLAGIRAAAARIGPHVHRTPVLKNSFLNETSGREVFFKCELFQKTGSFKARGACNAVLLTPPECRDIVTHSSGNHAQVRVHSVGATDVACCPTAMRMNAYSCSHGYEIWARRNLQHTAMLLRLVIVAFMVLTAAPCTTNTNFVLLEMSAIFRGKVHVV